MRRMERLILVRLGLCLLCRLCHRCQVFGLKFHHERKIEYSRFWIQKLRFPVDQKCHLLWPEPPMMFMFSCGPEGTLLPTPAKTVEIDKVAMDAKTKATAREIPFHNLSPFVYWYLLSAPPRRCRPAALRYKLI